LGVSFISFAAIVINNTPDTTYVTYVFSMFVWLVAAYMAVLSIRAVHGACTLNLLCNYLMSLSVMHCILALLIDQYAFFHNLADVIEGHKHLWVMSVNRLYSIGVELDTAGMRFSLVLVLIAYRLMHIHKDEEKLIPIYIAGFIVITTVGSMIARTTYVGVGIGIACMAYYSIGKLQQHKRVWQWLGALTICAIPVVSYLYNVNADIRAYIRFGFEGFFNMTEQGEWKIGSNETLKGMVVFPETMKTWIIGDGYIVNPKVDPYYTGKITEGYYMGTDIGYVRFIFYFGLTGLLIFSAFFVCVARNYALQHPEYKRLSFFLLLVHFIVWLKVASDCFIIFALIFFLDKEEKEQASLQEA